MLKIAASTVDSRIKTLKIRKSQFKFGSSFLAKLIKIAKFAKFANRTVESRVVSPL
jgi:hypothetical protein